jgi:hypothetical protein
MRTFTSVFTFAAIVSLAGAAAARDIEPGSSTTSCSAAPMRSTTASLRMERRGKKEANLPAKYDVAYPVHDGLRAQRERGSI